MGKGWSKDEAPQVPEHHKLCVIPQSSDKNSRVTEAITSEVKLPHNYEAIIKHADSPVDNSSTEKLYNQLRGGVFLNKKKKKYWVDEKSNKNCFMLFARDLTITWGADTRYWHWRSIQETSDVVVDVAELLDVSWLDICGRFEMANLSPGTVYEVVFLLMVKDSSSGFEVPVNIKLSLPDGTTQGHKENLLENPWGSWIEIPAGDLRASSEQIGYIQFSLDEHSGRRKKGLIVKGVVIRPKADVFVDVAELLQVCWLEIHGKFEMVNLSPGTVYEVVFLVMLKDSSSGWEVPVNVKLILPDGTTQQHEEKLMEKPRGSWIEIPAGEFRTSFEKIGDIQFSLYGYKGGKWKRGLIIKGVEIRPKA